MTRNATEPSPTAVRTIAAATISSIGIYIIVGIIWTQLNAPPYIKRDMADLLGIVFLPLGIILAAASFVTKRALNNQPGTNTVAGKMRTTLVALAIAEAPAVLGLAHVLLTNMLGYAAFLWAVSLVVAILHFPRRDWLEG